MTTRLARLVDEPRHARWLVLALLLGGTALRLHYSRQAFFGSDLGAVYEVAQGIATGTEFPLVGGKASWGGHAPFPGYYYLIAVPLLFSASPLPFLAWGALLGSLGLLLFVRLLWERYGPRAAVFGAALTTTLPWLLTSADTCEAVNLALPCAALELYALHRVIAGDRSRWAVAVPLAFMLHAHVYPNLPVMLAVGLTLWLVRRPNVAWGWLAAGVGLGLLTVVPSAVHLLREGGAGVGQWSASRPPALARELFDAATQTLAFSSGDLAYSIDRGFWWGFDRLAWFRGFPETLQQTYGLGLGVYVLVSMLVALLCWGWAGGRTLLAFGRRGRAWLQRLRPATPRPVLAGTGDPPPGPEDPSPAPPAPRPAPTAPEPAPAATPAPDPDPLLLALAAGVLASLLLAALSPKGYQPRYNNVLIWLTLIPLVRVIHDRSRLAPLLWLWLLVTLPANLAVAQRYYDQTVPPNSVTTQLEIVDRIVVEQQGRPFELRPYKVVGNWDKLARHRHGTGWNLVKRAAVRYEAYARSEQAHYGPLLRQPTTRVWPLTDAYLLRVRGH